MRERSEEKEKKCCFTNTLLLDMDNGYGYCMRNVCKVMPMQERFFFSRSALPIPKNLLDVRTIFGGWSRAIVRFARPPPLP